MKLDEWVRMTKAEQIAFVESKLKDRERETYCIFCEKVLRIDECYTRMTDNGEDHGRKIRSERYATVCPKCDNIIRDPTL